MPSLPALRPLASRLISLTALLTSLTTGCDNECDFKAPRCNGNVVETCGEGPDQVAHRRIVRSPCEEPNGVCVDGKGGPQCVASSLTPCGSDFSPRCEADSAVSCAPAGYELLAVCDPAFAACHEALVSSLPVAVCLASPETLCDDTFVSRCEGALQLSCHASLGRVVTDDCARPGRSERGTCITSTRGGAYCN